ncbi:AraC family transcriptional regulator [Carboxylicivirga sp. M1479]|uniref:helix-turn-helix domain-containing protein n=1 Tax=Carboxylicivirga sp. M1479 TaxID=2594476 RepID=UPI001177ABA7|nr:AraC family transcriptional regulator [Carboxylicivirga sp. M1479]TRX70587.1 helix-turn-helix domain-containing protein [Carboxylicivirga sp. M1479]
MKNISSKNKIENEQLFKISRMKEVIKPTKPHKHAGYHELIILHEGAGIHTIDETDYEVNPPSLFYLKGGQVHCWEFTQIPKGYVMIFKEAFLDEFNDAAQLLSLFPSYLRLGKNDKNILQDFALMMSEFESANPNQQVLKSYLNVIIYKVNELAKTLSISKVEDKTVVAFKALVDQWYKEEKEITFYAGHLNITKRKLSTLCSKELGRPASSIIAERLVMESKRLLRYTNNTISEVAYELEYSDSSHFVKFFKSKTNLTPTEYRMKF